MSIKDIPGSNISQSGFGLRVLITTLMICASSIALPQSFSLDSMGVFFVGGERTDAPYSDGRDASLPTSGRSTVSHQGKVSFFIPETVTGANIILIPGFGLSSSIYLTTPDGREGWAQYFVRQGHPVYIMDIPHRSSSGFAIDAINGCMKADPAFPCTEDIMLGKTSLEQPWSVWGFGPEFGVSFPDSRFPAQPLQENYIEQFGASFEVFSGSGRMGAATNGEASQQALAELLDRVGPSVLIMHSAAGALGFRYARSSPTQVKALVAVETVACPAVDNADNPLAGIPFLALYGDYVEARSAGGHPRRRASCKAAADAIGSHGTHARFIDLPGELAIKGNSHLMMQDNNSNDLAGLISEWLQAGQIR
jgi:pimeloyl-ACP methyl ester carboxylesterase